MTSLCMWVYACGFARDNRPSIASTVRALAGTLGIPRPINATVAAFEWNIVVPIACPTLPYSTIDLMSNSSTDFQVLC